MVNYEQHVDAVLERHGVKPKRPLILQALGDIVNEVYDKFYDEVREEKPDLTVADSQREAIDKACKHCNAIKRDEWRDEYKQNGYIKIFSPLFGEAFYLCRDSRIHKALTKGKGEDIAYFMESELKRLQGLDEEELLAVYQGKKIFKGVII